MDTSTLVVSMCFFPGSLITEIIEKTEVVKPVPKN